MPDAMIYSISFADRPDPIDVVPAVLKSPMLIAALHPQRSIAVSFATEPNRGNSAVVFTLDSFHIDSLVSYLKSQEYVRKTLEMELPRDQEEWDPDGEAIRGDVWNWTKVKLLRFGLRRRRSDVSAFELVLDCDWDQEHVIVASFRDGRFVDLNHE